MCHTLHAYLDVVLLLGNEFICPLNCERARVSLKSHLLYQNNQHFVPRTESISTLLYDVLKSGALQMD
jgi:hypothetical protein